MDLSNESIERYARNIILPEVGSEGQIKLLNARVLIIGAGGLGSPLLMYLAASGVGNITIIDDDKVELSNLQRQVIHSTADIGKLKTLSAKKFINNINSDININCLNNRLNQSNVSEIIKSHDLIADGSDNFETRYLVADASYNLNKILVSAAITRFEGQISTWKNNTDSMPCFRCLFPNKPKGDNYQNCSTNGILGSIAGFFGSLQATEVIKEILNIGESLAGYLNIYDLLNNNFRKIKINKDPACKLCSKSK